MTELNFEEILRKYIEFVVSNFKDGSIALSMFTKTCRPKYITIHSLLILNF